MKHNFWENMVSPDNVSTESTIHLFKVLSRSDFGHFGHDKIATDVSYQSTSSVMQQNIWLLDGLFCKGHIYANILAFNAKGCYHTKNT